MKYFYHVYGYLDTDNYYFKDFLNAYDFMFLNSKILNEKYNHKISTKSEVWEKLEKYNRAIVGIWTVLKVPFYDA